MSHQEEWGPWVEHHGRGLDPFLVGKMLRVKGLCYDGSNVVQDGIVRLDRLSDPVYLAWDWRNFGKKAPGRDWVCAKIVCYRIRKPRGLNILQELVERLPEQVDI